MILINILAHLRELSMKCEWEALDLKNKDNNFRKRTDTG